MDNNSNMSHLECIRSFKNPIMEQQISTKEPKLGFGWATTKLCTTCALRAFPFFASQGTRHDIAVRHASPTMKTHQSTAKHNCSNAPASQQQQAQDHNWYRIFREAECKQPGCCERNKTHDRRAQLRRVLSATSSPYHFAMQAPGKFVARHLLNKTHGVLGHARADLYLLITMLCLPQHPTSIDVICLTRHCCHTYTALSTYGIPV